MITSNCIAKPNYLRILSAFLLPFVAAIIYGLRIHSTADSWQQFIHQIISSRQNTVSVFFVAVGIFAWLAIVWPKATEILRTRPCSIIVDQQNVTIYGDKYQMNDILSFEVSRKLFSINLVVKLISYERRYQIIFLYPNPEKIKSLLESLAVSSGKA